MWTSRLQSIKWIAFSLCICLLTWRIVILNIAEYYATRSDIEASQALDWYPRPVMLLYRFE